MFFFILRPQDDPEADRVCRRHRRRRRRPPRRFFRTRNFAIAISGGRNREFSEL